MSTNYYACPDAGLDGVHIGQRPAGLRGWLGTEPDGPGISLATWEEWKAYLLSDPAMVIRDEYDQEMTAKEFIALWEDIPLEIRRLQYDFCQQHLVGSPGDTTLDTDSQFTINWRDFS